MDTFRSNPQRVTHTKRLRLLVPSTSIDCRACEFYQARGAPRPAPALRVLSRPGVCPAMSPPKLGARCYLLGAKRRVFLARLALVGRDLVPKRHRVRGCPV